MAREPPASPHHVLVTLTASGVRTFRLPGPLALVQTDGAGSAQQITHINGLSLAEVAQGCPQVPAAAEAAADAAGHSLGGRLLTAMSRGGVTVRGLAVVMVHAGLLAPAGGCDASGAAACGAAAAEERRALQRHAARLTWGLAGIVFELMRCRAGHWPALGSPTDRQHVAGAVLEQLFRLHRRLALAVLRAHDQLCAAPQLFDEMLQQGLLPSPGKGAAAAEAEEARGCSAGPPREPTAEVHA